jgi:hypothetical protein
MLRIEVSEEGQPALPAIDADDAIVVIGSGATARVRLPAAAAREQHVIVEGGAWRALGDVRVAGAAASGGELGAGVELELAGFRVRIGEAPAGVVPSAPQRTESLARELVRGLLGGGAAPKLIVERGPAVGESRALAPPESVLVIGRGEEAGWPILDEDVSRLHAEIRRGWDGARIVDLGSKNRTKVDGAIVGTAGAALRDGATIELGKVVLRFRDPAEVHLRGEPLPAAAAAPARAASAKPPAGAQTHAVPQPTAPARSTAGARASVVPFYAAVTICALALAALAWLFALA